MSAPGDSPPGCHMSAPGDSPPGCSCCTKASGLALATHWGPSCTACLACREPAQNLADNLLRDFEDRWWTACRKVS